MNKKALKTNFILDYMKNNNVSKCAFCKMCKISIPSLNKVLTGRFDVDLKILYKIARVTKNSICDYFR